MFRLFSLLYVLLSATANIHAETVSIASGEWPPYVSEDLNNEGVVSDIIRSAYASVGLEVDFLYFPWNRSFNLTRRGVHHATPVWAKNPEREQQFLFTPSPVARQVVAFYYHVDNPVTWEQIWSMDYDQAPKIGATLGYHYSPKFTDYDNNNLFRLRRSPSDEDNFRLLLNKEIDVFPINLTVGQEMVKKNFTQQQQQQLAILPQALQVTDLFLMFSKKNPDSERFSQLFEQGLQNIRADGTMDKIVKQHGLDPLTSLP